MYGLIYEIGERKFSLISDSGELYYAYLKDNTDTELPRIIADCRRRQQARVIVTEFALEFESASPSHNYDVIEAGRSWTLRKAIKYSIIKRPETTRQVVGRLMSVVGSNPNIFGKTFQFQGSQAPTSTPMVTLGEQQQRRAEPRNEVKQLYGLITDVGDKRIQIVSQNGDQYYSPTDQPFHFRLRSKIEELRVIHASSRARNAESARLIVPVVPGFAVAFSNIGDLLDQEYPRATDLQLVEDPDLTSKVISEVKKWFWHKRAELGRASETKNDKSITPTLPPARPPTPAPVSPPPAPPPRITAKPQVTEYRVASNSLGFAARRLPRLAQNWTPRVSKDAWIKFHLALLSGRLIRIGHPVWARVYQAAFGPSCHLDILPIEPTWLCFDDVWSSGLKATWKQAGERTHTLHLFVLQDCELAACSTWSRPLINLHCDISHSLLPKLEKGWPDNLKLLWTCSNASYCLDDYSLRVMEHGSQLGLSTSSELVDAEVNFKEWELWAKGGDAQCPAPVPATTKLSTMVVKREMDRYFGAAVACGFEREKATELTQEAFATILEPTGPQRAAPSETRSVET